MNEAPSIREIRLACIVCHLAEYIETDHEADYQAAAGITSLPDIAAFFKEAKGQGVLPVSREPIHLLDKMYE